MLLESPYTETRLLTEEKIGEGDHREVYRSGSFAIKILKPLRVKRSFFRTVRVPLQSHILEKHGIEDFNQHEHENYLQLAHIIPARLRDLFNTLHWAGYYRGQSMSISDLVLNDDGSLAQPLARVDFIQDARFWSAFDEMERLLLCSKMFFTGINGENILVRIAAGIPKPVIVDYKWLGREAYPGQFWLRTETGLRRKLRRKFQRVRDLYQLH